MTPIKIMIVEDEIIVAKDIQRILKKLGYEAFDPIPNGKKALDSIEKLKPDLVLLDINLKNSDLDGIQVAEQIQEHYKLPFIFLTAFSDKHTLERAKLTEPYGYIIKPFEESDIRTAIEIAHYKYLKDLETADKGNRYASALDHLDVSVIITDSAEKISFINRAAEMLTGSMKRDILNKEIGSAFKHSSAETKTTFKTLAHSALTEGLKKGVEHDVTVSNGILEHRVSISMYPIMSIDNKASGCAFVLSAAGKKGEPEPSTDKTLFNFLENAYSANSFFVKKDSRFVRVSFSDILWIEALDNYIVIKTTSKEQFILHSAMKEIEARLPVHSFVRVHRSYIVQTEKIIALEGDTCIIDDSRIPLGKAYKDNLLARINLI
jgi:DNA-binding LytR/AlgR family response regulator